MAPQWLAYLPPTMSPSETSNAEGWLERPEEAFAHFRERGVTEVVCEEKHMGSRAVIALCRSARAAAARFDARNGEPLWHSGLISNPSNAPITYMLDGHQYVVVAGGANVYAFRLQ